MILSEQYLLEIRINLEELITRREGFIALNTERLRNGYAPGYSDTAFGSLETEMRILREQLIHLGEK